MAKNFKEYSISELSLENDIVQLITNKNYLSATLLAYSLVEYILQQIIIINSKQITPETYNKINRIKLPQAGLLMYYEKIIDAETLKAIDFLNKKRNGYAHDVIEKHLSKKKEDFESILSLYNTVFKLYVELAEFKKPLKYN